MESYPASAEQGVNRGQARPRAPAGWVDTARGVFFPRLSPCKQLSMEVCGAWMAPLRKLPSLGGWLCEAERLTYIC
eukprot:365906-Chlamydomonas_euryale.AAC.20